MRKTAIALLGLAAILTAAVAWLQRPDDITAAEAVRAAEGAFEAAGLDGSLVDPDPVAGSYDAGEDQAPLGVWKTSATLEEGTVELWLSRDDGEPVFLDDRTPDGTAQILTDAQFRAIGDHVENPALGRQVRRNLVMTLAAALVVGLAVLQVVVDDRHARRRAAHSLEPC